MRTSRGEISCFSGFRRNPPHANSPQRNSPPPLTDTIHSGHSRKYPSAIWSKRRFPTVPEGSGKCTLKQIIQIRKQIWRDGLALFYLAWIYL